MPVLEIGPGMGVLTQFLLQNKEIDLTCVELDSESVTYLLANFPELNGRIIEGDFLKMNLNEMYKGQFCVIGNFPYNISSQIFFKVLDHKDKIPICAGMIQKEVAERMASKPGTKAYGILSVLVQAYYDIEYLFTVHENVFDPPPKVKSAVIRMRRNETKKIDCDEDLFVKVVKTAFNQRRKMMRNSLQAMLGQGHPLLADPVFMKRPEQLSVAEFVDLTNLIAKNISV
jgi:16S rRNA (adenine1518-N6/adenine1519-N6)-dimethyltransferase